MTNTIEAVARAIANASADVWENWGIGTDPADWRDEAQAAITAHTKALIEGAGEIGERLLKGVQSIGLHDDNNTELFDVSDADEAMAESAATIAAQKAEIERLTEREAQAKLDGVRLRIALHDAIRRPMGVVPASADEFYSPAEADAAERRRVERSTALSDLIAGDADLIDGDPQ